MSPHSLRVLFLCALTAGGAAPALAQTPPRYTITTIAGTGIGGFEGDGGPGASAQVNQPIGLFLRANGDLYIADTLNFRIRLLNNGGTISTVAGSGTTGYQGDDGSATAARIASAYGVVVDSAGVVYIADSTNNVIRRVSGGNITTYAGVNQRGFSGDGGAAKEARLALPTGIALGPNGSVYFADTLNNRIRRIDSSGNISTIAGNGDANYNGDDIPATSATLNRPTAIRFDSAGNLYIADTFNHRIRKIDTEGTITTVAGSGFSGGFSGDGGPATSAVLNYPRGLAVDGSSRVYIADTFNNRVRMVAEDGRIFTIAGDGRHFDSGDGGPALSAQMRFPRELAVRPDGAVIIADTESSRIRLITPDAQQPVISQGGVVTPVAFGGSPAAAPGSWIEIYGRDLSARTRQWEEKDFVDGRAPVTLGGTSVTVGGQEAFVSFVSPGQVNVQIPSSVVPGTHEVVVHTAEGDSAPYAVHIDPVEPAVLAPAVFAVAERQYAAGLLEGESFAVPAGAIAGLPARAARPGETITFYGVGFGPVAPLDNPGEIARRASSLTLPLQVYFGDTPATVSYAGLAPGAVGLYQINVIVPVISASDAVPLRFAVGGEENGQSLYTAVGR